MSEQRRYYRIVYPPLERPVFSIHGKSFDVQDVSEKGIGFFATGTFNPPSGSQIEGILTFADNKSYEIIGVVIRVDPRSGLVAVNLINRIPLPKIMEEQRLMIKKFKS